MSAVPTTGPRAGSPFPVVIPGIATTIAALAVVYVLAHGPANFSAMGWYLDYVIPAGAMLTGLAASSGYALGSWLSGVKISKGLLVAVLTIQVLAYFGALYIEFSGLDLAYEDGSPVGFFAWLDVYTRSLAWVQEDGTTGAALGAWGYGLRALELIGFSFGSLIAPLVLRSRPYCDACALYMRRAETALVPVSVPAVKIKKRDTQARAAHDAEQQAAWTRGMELLETLHGKVEGNDPGAFRDLLKPHLLANKQNAKLPARVQVDTYRCPRCEGGELRALLCSGQGQHQKQKEIAREALPQFFARSAKG
jgi:hypothetical protein